MMSDKSPRKSMSKKSGKSLKEKRADKKAKSSEHTVIETAFHAKKRGSTPPSWDGGFGSVMSDDCSGFGRG